MTDKTTAEVLEAAADLIEPKGRWMQGAYGDNFSKCWCLLGAIRQAGGYPHDVNPAANAMQKFLGVIWVHEWNDKRGRTQEQVVAALRGAAAALTKDPS